MATIYEQTLNDIDGKQVALSTYKGKVLLFVNVASKCGYTPQYKDLEALWEKYQGKDFVLLGVPSNDFGAQEPGTEAEIKEFCSLKYNVSFPMLSKLKVKGTEQHPLYAALSEKAGEPKWNFHKYLVGKNGEVIGGYKSSVAPLSTELTGNIDRALAQ
jgi:glutathione peroxidase